MKLNIIDKKSVVVITPTIASPKLLDAINSVDNQTYPDVKHLVVADGVDYWYKLANLLDQLPDSDTHVKLQTTLAPENTGANGFYGHRIYAAYSHLVNADYVFFLDEDNWYEPNHVETLVKTIQDNKLDFAYSLRAIYDANKNYVCDDNCESLGEWPIFLAHEQKQDHYLVDTSSYAFDRECLIKIASLWHSGWGGDRRFFASVKDHLKHANSRQRTLCYRLDGNDGSVSKPFFDRGNEYYNNHYNGKLPWIKV